jgi:hypothetical protein
MSNLNRGDLVELDGLLAVIVGIEGDPHVPDDHVAVWFGDPKCTRASQGGSGGMRPEVWTVPAEFLSPAAPPDYRH